MSTTIIADPLPSGIERSEDFDCDIYTGPMDALIAAGIIECHHLPPQQGRPAHMTAFFPDGSPVPRGGMGVPREAGHRVIEEWDDGRATVRVYVCAEERRIRRRDAPMWNLGDTNHVCYEGNREQLVAHGLPAAWMDETTKKSGKCWAKRTIHEPRRKIEIRLDSDDRFHVDIKMKKSAVSLEMPVPEPAERPSRPTRPALRLVWSAP